MLLLACSDDGVQPRRRTSILTCLLRSAVVVRGQRGQQPAASLRHGMVVPGSNATARRAG